MEGSGEGSAGCVVHVDVHGECVTLWVAAMHLLLGMAGIVLSCMQKLSSTDLYDMLGVLSYVVK